MDRLTATIRDPGKKECDASQTMVRSPLTININTLNNFPFVSYPNRGVEVIGEARWRTKIQQCTLPAIDLFFLSQAVTRGKCIRQ